MGKIRWSRILICAVLAAILALGVVFGALALFPQNLFGIPEKIITTICPQVELEEMMDQCLANAESDDPVASLVTSFVVILGCGAGYAIFCVFKLFLVALIAYIPITAFFSAVLNWILVKERRLIHVILSTMVSIPIAIGILIILGILLSN